MRYKDIITGIFLKRPNRFIAQVLVDGREEIAHVKNTGRCRELLLPGVTVYLQEHDNPKRKTRFSLIAVQKGDLLVNIDSQAPNKVMLEALTQGITLPGLKNYVGRIQPESVYGNSRFDFYIETDDQQAYLEIKGVTLEDRGVAKFPDAPTERGVKHIRELIEAVNSGFLAYIIFVVQMKGIAYMTPNDETHMAFGRTLREAHKAGVKVLAYDCTVTPDTMQIDQIVPVIL
jgi:sugar fermentation stimulation protein A